MKLHVIITTFNRSEMLELLLYDIKDNISNHEISVSIFDDGSEYKGINDYAEMNLDLCMDCNEEFGFKSSYYRNATNGGKKKYFELINKAFSNLPQADFYFILADDMRLLPNYFNKAIKLFQSIQQYDKVCMNTDVDGRLGKECWTGFKPQDYGTYYKSQWFDLCGIMTKRFFDSVGKISVGDRWKLDETLGSGVGAAISRTLHEKGLGMYHAKEILLTHGNHESKMNPQPQAI